MKYFDTCEHISKLYPGENNMQYLIFDIEITGLERTSDFICAAFSDKYFTTNIEECVQHLIDNLEAGVSLVTHNGVSFDWPYLLYQSKYRRAKRPYKKEPSPHHRHPSYFTKRVPHLDKWT